MKPSICHTMLVGQLDGWPLFAYLRLFEEREVIDGYGQKHINPFITSCPAGRTPNRSHYHHCIGKMETLYFPETCQNCALRAKCPVRYASRYMIVTIHAKPLRMSQRRKEQETDDFKIKYRQRSGIESTISLLKRVTRLERLRVRGKTPVFHFAKKTSKTHTFVGCSFIQTTK